MAAPGKDTQGDERMRKLLAVLCIIGCIALYSSETHQPATTRPAKSPASDSQTVKTQEAKQEKPAAKAQDQPVEKPAKNWYQVGYSDGFQDAGKGIYQPKSEREDYRTYYDMGYRERIEAIQAKRARNSSDDEDRYQKGFDEGYEAGLEKYADPSADDEQYMNGYEDGHEMARDDQGERDDE